jgi:hypothetical protein
MTEARLDLQSGDGVMFGPSRNNENSLIPMEIGMTSANDSTVNRLVVASDSSQGEPAASANSLSTDNAPVAQIETDRSDLVSPVEQVSSVGGTNLTPPFDSKNPQPLKEVPVSTVNGSTINTPVVAGDASQGEAVPAASDLATDQVAAAQIKTDPPNSVSPVERVPDPPGGSATAPLPDPFDPASLRLSGGDFNASVSVKKVLMSVPVRKPDKSWFVRVHDQDDYRLLTAVIELKEDRETYLVAPDLWPALATEATFGPRAFYTAINRQGVVFLWQIRLPGSDGKLDDWNKTALEAAKRATAGWVRVSANMALGAYDVFEAAGSLTEPAWPDIKFRDLLAIAFKDKVIDSMDHPVLRKLRGEV